jgi:hypothetical protein
MSTPISLHKSSEAAGIHLRKSGVDLDNLPACRVALVADVTGSFQDEYFQGHVQNAVTRLLGIAMHIDDSKKMDVFTFAEHAHQLRYPITEKNYENYVQRHILDDDSVHKWGATYYAPPIHLLYQHYFPTLTHLHSAESAKAHIMSLAHHGGGFLGGLFGHHKHETPPPAPVTVNHLDHDPVLALFVTDGENYDHEEALHAIHASNGLRIFWVLVGVGNDNFAFLKRMAGETDAEFINLSDIRADDQTLLNTLVTPKLVRWLNSHKVA